MIEFAPLLNVGPVIDNGVKLHCSSFGSCLPRFLAMTKVSGGAEKGSSSRVVCTVVPARAGVAGPVAAPHG